MTFAKLKTFLILAMAGAISPVLGQASLPAELRINGKKIWEAFEPQRMVLQQSSAVIYTDGKSRIKTLYGVVVSETGHVLTKASEIEGKENLSLRIGSDLYTDLEVLGVDEQWDVAMLKIKSDKVFTPVRLSEQDDVQQGHWVVSNGSTTRSQRRVRVGIVSAVTRAIKSNTSKVILGVLLGEESKDGLRITKVSPKTGAAQAGLKADDIILTADGKPLKERADLLNAMIGKNPGEMMALEIIRGKKKMSFEVELMPRGGDGLQITRNDQMSGGKESLSKRRAGFPRVIHHDTPLTRLSVGGPLLSLDGECIGMNIARASRVATFAIPAKELRQIITTMIKSDGGVH